MQISLRPPAVHKHAEIDRQFGQWGQFLNELSIQAFALAIACLGLQELRHIAALACLILIVWQHNKGLSDYFPAIITRLRKEKSKRAKQLESAIWKEHIDKKLFHYLPVFMGFGSLCLLGLFPLIKGNFSVYYRPLLDAFRAL